MARRRARLPDRTRRAGRGPRAGSRAPSTARCPAGFLASLSLPAYDVPEDVLIGHDSTRLPDWEPWPAERPDWLTFSNGREHIRIGNVNRTPLENTLGIDLIYRHVEADTFVLIQYKRMKREVEVVGSIAQMSSSDARWTACEKLIRSSRHIPLPQGLGASTLSATMSSLSGSPTNSTRIEIDSSPASTFRSHTWTGFRPTSPL